MKYSTISSSYAVTKDAVYTDAFIIRKELIEEVDFFQFEQDSVEFNIFTIET